MPTDPPVGTPPPGEPCAPCAPPPEDCLASIRSLQQQVCDLNTNYTGVLSQYSEVRKALVSQGQVLRDVTSLYNQLQQQLNNQDGASCARFGLTTTPGAIIACDNGRMSKLAAPTNDGLTLISADGKWTAADVSSGFVNAGQAVLFSGSSTNAGQNFSVTLPSFPKFKKYCLALLQVVAINLNSGASSTDIAWNTISIGHCGPQSQESVSWPLIPVSTAAQTFVVTASGDPRTWTATVRIIGYLFQ